MVELIPAECLSYEDSTRRTALNYLCGQALEATCLQVITRLQMLVESERERARARERDLNEKMAPGAENVALGAENSASGASLGKVRGDVLRHVVLLRSEDGRTALHVASAKGQLKVVQKLLAIGRKELACAVGEDGNTSLHWAALSGYDEVCCELIAVGGKELVMMPARDGWSALCWAAGWLVPQYKY